MALQFYFYASIFFVTKNFLCRVSCPFLQVNSRGYIYGKFENIQMFPGIGADLSKRVSFRTDYKYAVWENYVIIYKVGEAYVEICRVVNRYRDITRIFE